ncbi:MAG: cysteine desulfurase family protein [Thermodesulfobacteriota bacterium]|jgi:cysteine desulfurase
MDQSSIYLDNAASTRVDPRVIETMLPYLSQVYGNPSSLHSAGREAKEAMEKARALIAECTGAKAEEIVFTSGGTESNNLAIKGIALSRYRAGKHIIISAIEHDCVLNACGWLKTMGFDVDFLPVDENGIVRINELEKTIRSDTILVSAMHANNEIGTIQPIQEIGSICKAHGIPFHSDASQSFSKIPFDVNALNLDLATVNSHKIYGPKGVGALFIRKGIRITPLLHGGGHEYGLRSSTENIPGIVGFAHAAFLCRTELEPENRRLTCLRDKMIDTILEAIPVAYLNGHRHKRLPNNINMGFRGLEGEAIKLLLRLDEEGIEVSTGSACSSNDAENKPSHVLTAIGLNPVQARGAIRITLGRFTTDKEVGTFLQTLMTIIKDLKPITSI